MQSCRLQHRNGHTGHPIILVIQNADFPRPLLFTPALKSGRKAMKRQQNFCRIVSDQSRESIMIRSPEAIQPLLPICAVVAGNNMTVTSERQQSRRLRSEEHTSELQSLMRISYAVFCLTKKKQIHPRTHKY